MIRSSGGCYRKDLFKKIGMFNENLIRSQDMEFNLRLKRAGGKTLISSKIISYYHSKENMINFFRHNFMNGIWAIYPLKFTRTSLRLRHYIPFLFVLSLLLTGTLGIFYLISLNIFFAIVVSYLVLSLFFSGKISLKERNILLLFILPVSFLNRHIAYGLGSIMGFIKLFLPPYKI